MTRPNQRGSRVRTYYGLFLEIGLTLALILLVTATRIDFTPQNDGIEVRLQTQEVVEMEEITQTEQQTEPPPPPKAPVPVEVPDNTVVDQENVNFDATLDLSASLDTTAGPPRANGPEPPTTGEEPSDEIFVVVEEQPELIGGMAALQQEIDYPSFAEKAGIEGRVFVEFVVDEEGNVQNPTITRGVHKLLNKEALRVVKEMTFRPGKQRGTSVKVQMTLPVNFELKEGPPPSEQ